MENLIEVRGLCKRYAGFALEDVDFTVPAGEIVGLIGENGAGKTTLLKAILNVVHPDGGEIRLMDGDPANPKSRRRVAAVFEDAFFCGSLLPRQIGRIMEGSAPDWDGAAFSDYLRRFDLPADKPVKDFSRGMGMKLRLATALSQRPQLLILDEATSGLDPVVRGEMLDLLLEFIQDERRGVVLSTHITSDLEKIADQVAYLHRGRMRFQRQKDVLMEDMAIVRGPASMLDVLPEALILARQDGAMGATALVQHPEAVRERLPHVVMDRASLDDMMQLYAGRDET